MYHDVLVPTDGSDCATAALDLAEVHGATVHPLRGGPSVTHVSPELGADTILDALESQGGSVLATAHERAEDRDGAVETTLRQGLPRDEVLAAVDDTGADVVVMGTHGRSGLDRSLVGSVAERVVHCCAMLAQVFYVRTANHYQW